MKNNKSTLIYIAGALTVVSSVFSSCKKEFDDPSRAKTDVALGSTQALSAVAVGIQRSYTLSRTSVLFNSIAASGFVTNELKLLNAGNIPELQLSTGGAAVDGTNSILYNLWATANKVIHDSDLVIANAEKLGDKTYASGLIGYVTIYKALSLGNLSEFWEKVPVTSGQNVPFVPRADGYKAAIAAIDKALALIAANPVSVQFYNSIPSISLSNAVVPSNNIINVLHALKARYALFTGQYALALAEANLVTSTPNAVFKFDSANPNVLYSVISSNNVFQPTDANLGLPTALIPDATDKRLQFYTAMQGTPTATLRMTGFATSPTAVYPIFLPGEITLIKAEAYARQTTPDLANALTQLNSVVTKTTDAFAIGAALPALVGPFTQTQILDLIYKHRCIELFASGLKLEDMRRFGRPVSEMKRNFMPYPFQERDNNTNTPTDPAF
jgi:hypothetical protein